MVKLSHIWKTIGINKKSLSFNETYGALISLVLNLMASKAISKVETDNWKL